MKKQIKVTKQQKHQLDVIKHSERRKPLPRPVVFKTKKDYNRQVQNRETAEQCREIN